jgi:hypothetical protein
LSDELASTTKRQSALLEKVFGDTDAIEAKLDEFKSKLDDPATWPADAAEADRLVNELRSLIDGIPPLAQEHFLPRINPIRWSVEALWVARHRDDESGDDVDDRMTACQSLLDDQPTNASEAIVKLLSNLRDEADAAAKAEAVKTAETSLDSGAGIEAAWSALESYDDIEIIKLRLALRAKLLAKQIRDRAKSLREQLDRATKLPDETLRRVGVTRIYESAVAMKVDFLLADEPGGEAVAEHLDPLIHDAERALTRLADDQREVDAARIRSYQSWALEQIQQCERWYYDGAVADFEEKFGLFKSPRDVVLWELLGLFPTVRALLAEKTQVAINGNALTAEQQTAIYNKVYGKVSWKYVDDLAFRTTREALVKYLGPIDERYLDPPVLQLYNKAFQRGWTKLDGRDDQLYVAKQAARIEKRSPSNPKEEK